MRAVTCLAFAIVMGIPRTPVAAQTTASRSTDLAGPVVPGTLRGTVELNPNASNRLPGTSTAVTGTARWRIELDSLDWRRKLTLRLRVDGPDTATYVIRTASPRPPGPVLRVKNVAFSHIDPRYFTATMSVRERQTDMPVDYAWAAGKDTVAFDSTGALSRTDSLAPGAVLRGAIRLFGWHVEGGLQTSGHKSSRLLQVAFAATFDPRPAPTPRTMTDSVQARIMDGALYDFMLQWAGGIVNPSIADSTKDNDKARAYLRSRWNEAAIIDSVAVGKKAFYVRMRGRYAPVSCLVTGHMNRPTCTQLAHGKGSRLLQWFHW